MTHIEDYEHLAESQRSAVSIANVAFMDNVMVSWAIDAHTNAVKLGFPAAGVLWGMSKPGRRWLVNLDPPKLMAIDRQISALPYRTGRKVIFVEYFIQEPRDFKARRFGISRRQYERRLDDLLESIYDLLRPGIDSWPRRD